MVLSTEEIEKRIADSYELPNNVLDRIPDPLVSVRTSTYNHGPYIKQCIEGVLMQKTSFPFEFIIGEDCSTDETREIVFEYAKKYPNIIRVVTADYNVGSKANGRRCIRRCRGKYMALCEGDDYWIDPLKLQKQVDFLENNPEYSMCHTSFKYYYETQQKFIESKDLQINLPIINNGLSLEDILSNYRIQTVTVVLNLSYRNLLCKEDSFLYMSDYFLMGDTQLWYGLLTKGKIGFIPNVTSVYRKNNTSMTRTPNYKAHYRFELSSSELRKYLAERDSLSPIFKEKINKQYTSRLINYLAFDPNFTPYFLQKNLKEGNIIKYYLLKCHILRTILIIRIKAMRFVGCIRRVFINSL